MVEVTFALPTTTEDGVSLRHHHTTLENWLTRTYHGYTQHEAFGSWESPDGRIVRERNLVYSVSTEVEGLALLLNYISSFKEDRTFGQEAIYVKISGGSGLL